MSEKMGRLVLYSGCSGVGKGTILKELTKRDSSIKLSVSNTTRAPRPDEVDGVDYNFVTKEEFESVFLLRRELNGLKSEEAAEKIIDMFARSKSNDEVVEMARKVRFADI